MPAIAVGRALTHRGHDVVFITPRRLAIIGRKCGMNVRCVGGTNERQAPTDDRLTSNRCGGADSWRRAYSHYLLPFLERHYSALEGIIDEEAIDVVVASSLALWGPLAAAKLGIPWTIVYTSPQHLLQAGSDRPSDRRLLETLWQWIDRQYPTAWISSEYGITASGPAMIAHEYGLVGDIVRRGDLVGYPQCGGIFTLSERDADTVQAFIGCEYSPKIVVILGSMFSSRLGTLLEYMSASEVATDAAVLWVGANAILSNRRLPPGWAGVGQISLCEVYRAGDMVIHHGGSGTMYGVLRAGLPSIVVPQGFDNGWNGRLLERRGVGKMVDATTFEGMRQAIDWAQLAESRHTVARMVPQIGSSEAAVERIAIRLECLT